MLDIENVKTHTFLLQDWMKALTKLSNAHSKIPNDSCVNTYSEELWKCIFGQYLVDFIDTPVFIL